MARTRRRSTLCGVVLPRGKNSRASKKRRSLACTSSEIFPISSKKTVPPFATLKIPGLSWCAPVNAPLVCPNSSLSSNVSEMVPQSTAEKDAFLLLLLACIALAINSLPVPLSPEMRTVESVGATFLTISITFFILGLSPMSW